MKNWLIPLFTIAYILGLTSCFTSPSTSQNSFGFIKTLELSEDEIFYKNIAGETADKYIFSPFYVASNMLMLNEWLEFEKNLSLGQQYELAMALFANLPDRTDSGDMRVVAVGKFFDDGQDLLFFIRKVPLKPGAVPGQENGILVLTNCLQFKSENKESGKIKMLATDDLNMISTNLCYYKLFIAYPDGELVDANNLNLDNAGFEELQPGTDMGNMMDLYIKDEHPQNDAHIETMYHLIIDQDNQDPMVALLATMNFALYQLKIYDFTKAMELFSQANMLIPEYADEAIYHVLDYEAVFLYKMIQAITYNDKSFLSAELK